MLFSLLFIFSLFIHFIIRSLECSILKTMFSTEKEKSLFSISSWRQSNIILSFFIFHFIYFFFFFFYYFLTFFPILSSFSIRFNFNSIQNAIGNSTKSLILLTSMLFKHIYQKVTKKFAIFQFYISTCFICHQNDKKLLNFNT